MGHRRVSTSLDTLETASLRSIPLRKGKRLEENDRFMAAGVQGPVYNQIPFDSLQYI